MSHFNSNPIKSKLFGPQCSTRVEKPLIPYLHKQEISEATPPDLPFEPLFTDEDVRLFVDRLQRQNEHPLLIQILVDNGDAMLPFNRDRHYLVSALRQLCGKNIFEVLFFVGDPLKGVGKSSNRAQYLLPPPGSIVLVVTDFGIGHPMFPNNYSSSLKDWIDFGKHVRAFDCSPVALVPYSPLRWPNAITTHFNIVQWDRKGCHFDQIIVPPKQLREDEMAIDEDMVDLRKNGLQRFRSQFPAAYKLAVPISLSTFIEPELLRMVRLKLFPQIAVGAEADLWFSPFVNSGNGTGFTFFPDVKKLLQEELSKDQSLLQAAWNILRYIHGDWKPAILVEEEINWLFLRDGLQSTNDIERRILAVTISLVEEGRNGLAGWAIRALPELPDLIRDLEATWVLALAASLRLQGKRVLTGLIPTHVMGPTLFWALSGDFPQKQVGVSLFDEGLRISSPPIIEDQILLVPHTTPIPLTLVWEEKNQKHSRTISCFQNQPFFIEGSFTNVSLQTGNGDYYRIIRQQQEGIKKDSRRN